MSVVLAFKWRADVKRICIVGRKFFGAVRYVYIESVLFVEAKEKRKPLVSAEYKRLNERRKWYHQESNRGHKDFQSFALPTELWHLYFLICVCKGSLFSVYWQIFLSKNGVITEICVPLQTQNAMFRDLAQLVAHYVRDVGVGRSSRLIPTLLEERKAKRLSLFCFIMARVGGQELVNNPVLSCYLIHQSGQFQRGLFVFCIFLCANSFCFILFTIFAI